MFDGERSPLACTPLCKFATTWSNFAARTAGNGDPIYLTNGVAPYAPGTEGRKEFGDWTYTAVFPICLERVVGEVCKPVHEMKG